MPRDDWEKNTIPELFRGWDAWPWPRGDNPEPKSVLDVACGLSLKSKFVGVGDWTVRVGLDIHRPYLEAVESDVSWVPICASVSQISSLFLPNTFDLVLALDIVEHLEKDEALLLLRDLEEVASVAVVIETTKGFLPQNLDILGFDQHHLQTHRCGFEPGELEDLGYRVFERDYKLAPVRRHTSEPVATECKLLNAIKEVGE